jgi:hypothetical protein
MFPTPLNSAASRAPIASVAQPDQAGQASARADGNAALKRDRSPSPPLPSSPTARKMEMTLRGQMDKKVRTAGEAGEVGASAAVAAAPPKTGLAHPEEINSFVAQMKAVQADWSAKTPEQKIEHFQQVISAKFEAAGMPAPGIELMPASGGRNGEFNAKLWSLGMTATTLAKPMAETAGTAYHESRHAQQFFMIAKYIAKENIAPPPHEQIPAHILAAAKEAEATSPMSPAESAEARLYHTSVYGADYKKRNITLTKLGTHTLASVEAKNTAYKAAKTDYETAVQVFDAHKKEQEEKVPDFKTDRAVREGDAKHVANHGSKNAALALTKTALAAFTEESAAFSATLAEYRALPEEADAFHVGDAVTARLNETASA